MIRLYRPSGQLYQVCYITEKQTKYKHILRHINKPVHPKFCNTSNKLYGIVAHATINLFDNGKIIDIDNNINYYINPIIVFTWKYYYDSICPIQFNSELCEILNPLIDVEDKTDDICIKYISKCPYNIAFIENPTNQFCEIAIRHNCNVLQHIPIEKRTYEICRIAVTSNGDMLEYVPSVFKTDELCNIALGSNNPHRYEGGNEAIKYIPVALCNYNKLVLGIQADYNYIKDIPRELVDDNLCKIAVQQNGMALEHIPKELITSDICKLAIEKYDIYNDYILQYIPKEYITEDICKLVVQKNGLEISYISNQTDEICKLAVKQNGSALKYVKTKTPEICKLAIQQNYLSIEFIPECMKTYEICIATARNINLKIRYYSHQNILEFIPNDMQTDELYKIVIEKNSDSIKFIPPHYLHYLHYQEQNRMCYI